MGTNYFEFLREGVRVLKPGGRLLIAEIRSRFEGTHTLSNEEPQSSFEGRKSGEEGGGAMKVGSQKRSREDEKEVGGGLSRFTAALESLGLQLVKKDEGNKMFVYFQFRKGAVEKSGGVKRLSAPSLKACTYKKR